MKYVKCSSKATPMLTVAHPMLQSSSLAKLLPGTCFPYCFHFIQYYQELQSKSTILWAQGFAWLSWFLITLVLQFVSTLTGHSSLSKGQLGHLRASFKTSENFTTQIIGGYSLIPNEDNSQTFISFIPWVNPNPISKGRWSTKVTGLPTEHIGLRA